MHPFDQATALTRTGPGSFEGRISGDWFGMRAPFGGAAAALMLRALAHVVDDPERPVRSFSTYFVDAPTDEPMLIAASAERRGGSLTAVTARAEQHGAVKIVSVATFSRGRESFSFDDARMPDVPPPGEAPPLPRLEGLPAFLSHFEFRPVFGGLPYTGGPVAETGGWVRTGEPRVLDAFLAAAFADVGMPSVFPRATFPVVTPTVDLTIHFLAPLPIEGARAGDFTLVRFRTQEAREGFFVEDGELWSADGRLLARSRQHALVLPVRR